ncbi:hypothetical protein LY90DRAFT_667698 [Neocallimastix californiae]|uniref:SPIN90/Ldb17 leucine-rich domain-containing protein n=1 Tax=Neocallimastix californiae TaxID=1754190 RepID=A0A1Y2E8G9_9FUNG|nr:hypothetical protein LY90DRAFT_667698 [Neocallimastix californiae]|eukprot:ORY67850.1 hypothetical protein LY90DRAFT_667698 [Neocallimastix californiae]
MVIMITLILYNKVALSNQIESKLKNRNKNDTKNIIKFNNIITVLKKRINKSKTLSENLIFILNRTDDFSVKLYILKFLYLVFSTPSLDKFFYTNDISVLLDVTIRELWNLTDEHTHVQKGYLLLLEKLIQYTINYNIPYRYHDIAELLYVISQRSKNTCYSNEIQHAKLVALSNIAQRIMNSFNSILKVSTITPVSSNENLHSLNTKDSSISLSSSNLKKKEKSKKNKSSKIQSKSDISITSLTPINKDHEDLSHKALDSFMKSNQQYHENNQVIQTIQSEPPAIEESPLSPVEEYRDHDKLSQKAINIFIKSYQQYNESNSSSEISTPSTRPTELDIESDFIPVVLSPPEEPLEENDSNFRSPIKEDKDHDKLSEKAMNIYMRSYQQYHESNPITENNNSSLTSTSINNEESQLSPIEEDRDHDKLSQRAMDIFMKSIQQYNNEQEDIHSSTLPPTYTEIENTSSFQSQQQETISTRESDVLSYSSNSTISNNGIPIPSRYESLRSDPVERTQSPFSDNYQISPQYNYTYNKGRSSITNSNIISSPALSAASYQSNYSTSSNSVKPYTYYPQPKTNNIFKREKLTDNSTVSPLNYGGRKTKID